MKSAHGRGARALGLAGCLAAAGLAAQSPAPAPLLVSPPDDALLLRREDGGLLRVAPLLQRRAVLGVEAVDVTPELRRHLAAPADRGVLVAEVAADGPAAPAVRVGDLLLSVGGEPVASVWELDSALRARVAGDRVRLELSRGGVAVAAEVELGASERATFDLGPVVWRLGRGTPPHRLLLHPPGGGAELVVDADRLDELASRLADRLGTSDWHDRLRRRDLAGRIAELEQRLAELEAELARLRQPQ